MPRPSTGAISTSKAWSPQTQKSTKVGSGGYPKLGTQRRGTPCLGTIPGLSQQESQLWCPTVKPTKMNRHGSTFQTEGRCSPGVWDTLWDASILGLRRATYGMYRGGTKGRERAGARGFENEQEWENRGLRG